MIKFIVPFEIASQHLTVPCDEFIWQFEDSSKPFKDSDFH